MPSLDVGDDVRRLDLFAPATLSEPYPAYRELRRAGPCVHLPHYGFWFVGRFAELGHASRQPTVFSSTGGVGPAFRPRPMMPMYDPPKHTQVRRLIAAHFTPRAIAALAPRIGARIDELFDALIDARGGDVVRDLGEPLVLSVIADLMDLPQSARCSMRRWAHHIMADLSGGLDVEAAEAAEASRVEFVGFLKELAAARAARPGNDIISRLVAANQADALSRSEVIAFAVLLLVAAFEPTVYGLGNIIVAWLEHPHILRRVLDDPACIPAAIEETLRYDAPVQAFFRNTLVDSELGGVTIPRGAKVMLNFGSANRDEAQYPNPDVIDLERRTGDHIAFGAGVHYCLGASLARLQLHMVTRALASRVARIELRGEPERACTMLFRGFRTVPVDLLPR